MTASTDSFTSTMAPPPPTDILVHKRGNDSMGSNDSLSSTKRISGMDDSGTLFFDRLQQRFLYPSLRSMLDGTMDKDRIPSPATRRSTLSSMGSSYSRTMLRTLPDDALLEPTDSEEQQQLEQLQQLQGQLEERLEQRQHQQHMRQQRLRQQQHQQQQQQTSPNTLLPPTQGRYSSKSPVRNHRRRSKFVFVDSGATASPSNEPPRLPIRVSEPPSTPTTVAASQSSSFSSSPAVDATPKMPMRIHSLRSLGSISSIQEEDDVMINYRSGNGGNNATTNNSSSGTNNKKSSAIQASFRFKSDSMDLISVDEDLTLSPSTSMYYNRSNDSQQLFDRSMDLSELWLN